MSAWRFTDNARLTRRVTTENGTISVVDAIEDWFPAQRVRPGRNRPGLDRSSLRRVRSDLLRYRCGFLGPAGDSLRAGDRVDLDGEGFEILEDPREVHLGRSIIGHEVPMQKTETLYPFEGAIAQQGGDVVKVAVRFSVYSVDETHETTGTYEDFSAETDLSNHAECKINHQFVSDGRIYKITSAENDLVGGYVRMTVRKSGAQG